MNKSLGEKSMIVVPPIIRRNILKKFLGAGAISEDTAIHLSELNLCETKVLLALIRDEKIIKTSNNKYYINKF